MQRYAVFGYPISHSLSPKIHAEFAKQTQQNMQYEAIEILPGEFSNSLNNFFSQGGCGGNVTLPYKEDAFRFVQHHTPFAHASKAVNTLRLEKNGELWGDNTDGVGFIRDLCGYHGHDLRNKTVLILGAGGAVRGILPAMIAEQARQVIIVNRTLSKAIALIKDFLHLPISLSALPLSELTHQKVDMVINGTCASLQGEVLPIPKSLFANNPICYDLMYGEKSRVFTDYALQCGASCAYSGIGMLIEQAAESFFLWRGVRPETRKVRNSLII